VKSLIIYILLQKKNTPLKKILATPLAAIRYFYNNNNNVFYYYIWCFQSLHPITNWYSSATVNRRLATLKDTIVLMLDWLIKLDYFKNIFYFISPLYYLYFQNKYTFLESGEDFWYTLYIHIQNNISWITKAQQ